MRAAGNFWRGTLQNGTTQMINKCYKPKRKQWICAWCIAIRGHMYVPCHATLSQSMDVYGWMGRMDGCCVEIYFSDIFITDERTIKWTKKKNAYRMWMTRRLSLEWISSTDWFHLYDFDSLCRFFRSTYEMVVLAGIQKRAVRSTTVTAIFFCLCVVFS